MPLGGLFSYAWFGEDALTTQPTSPSQSSVAGCSHISSERVNKLKS